MNNILRYIYYVKSISMIFKLIIINYIMNEIGRYLFNFTTLHLLTIVRLVGIN